MSRQLPDRLRRHCVRPGQVLNPEGRNQFTYRRDFEATIQRLAEGKWSGEVEDCEDADARCWLCDLRRCEHYATGIGPVHSKCLEQVREMNVGEILARVALQRALKGDEKLLTETLRRFWPVLEKRELVLSSTSSGRSRRRSMTPMSWWPRQ